MTSKPSTKISTTAMIRNKLFSKNRTALSNNPTKKSSKVPSAFSMSSHVQNTWDYNDRWLITFSKFGCEYISSALCVPKKTFYTRHNSNFYTSRLRF